MGKNKDFTLRCKKDAVKDGEVLFTEGKEYNVKVDGDKWKTKDNKGSEHEVNSKDKTELRFLYEYFEDVSV